MRHTLIGRMLSLALLFSMLLATSSGAKPPLWDTATTSTGRFKVLSQFGGDAVFDKETGLVWQRSPATGDQDWQSSVDLCLNAATGNRRGWRLPTVNEILTLGTVAGGIAIPPLPAGHPFTNVQQYYWTATTYHDAGGIDLAFLLDFANPTASTYETSKSGTHPAWCVRAGGGIDGKNVN